MLSFLRAVVALEPEQVLFENVVALRWRGQAFLDELTARLGALGYDVGVRIVHAEAYGVPQLRRRLVLIATRLPGGVSWPQPTHAMSKPNFPKDQPGVHLEAPLAHTVRDAIADLAVPQAESLTATVEPLAPVSAFARWATGEVGLDELVPSASTGQALVPQGGRVAR